MKNFVQSILVLFSIAAVTVATSTNEGRNVPVTRSYNLSSNCSNATFISGTLIATDNNVTTPFNTTYLNTGLPVASLIIGGETNISGTIATNLVRTCALTTSNAGSNVIYIYNCTDTGGYTCTVSFTQLP